MSKVVQLKIRSHRQSAQEKQAALLRCFAHHRRFGDDVFWLKENAELLNILECSGGTPGRDALETHEGFYRNIEKRLSFFPQYYRFLLSICLDLEDLGMAGNKGEALVNWAADQGLARCEISDLQRLEARRIMQRRGRDPLPEDAGLEARMRGFIDQSKSFALPNKKIAYELTHTVFYLSEYGRKDPDLGAAAVQSLMNAGTLAYLDQNADLLAEVCVALRYGGQTPPHTWEDWVMRTVRQCVVADGPDDTRHDDYHQYFVSNWLLQVAERPAFEHHYTAGRMTFHAAQNRIGPLRDMSECMFRLDDQRSDDWGRMRARVVEALSSDGLAVLEEAEAGCSDFGAFFAGFARAGLPLDISAARA